MEQHRLGYPNHYEMKQNRLKVLLRAKGLCEICGRKGKHIHHKDGGRLDHSLENLIFVCLTCHHLIHQGRKNHTSRFIRLYGYNLREISERLNCTISSVSNLHRKNKLKEVLTNLEKVIK